jgi:hypothetical protein
LNNKLGKGNNQKDILPILVLQSLIPGKDKDQCIILIDLLISLMKQSLLPSSKLVVLELILILAKKCSTQLILQLLLPYLSNILSKYC